MKILRAAVAVGFSLLLITAAAETQPSVAAFVAPPQYRHLSLSPDGRKLATVTPHEFADHVALIDLETMKPLPGVSFDDAEPLAMWWKGNDRLLFLVRNYHGESFFRTFHLPTKKISRLSSFNPDAYFVLNSLPNDPEHLLITSLTGTGVALQRYNIATGKHTTVEKNPGFVFAWFVDHAGQAVAGFGELNDEWFLMTRQDVAAPWSKVSLGRAPRSEFQPGAVHHDQRRLIGWDFTTADTARAVVRDPQTGETELLFHSPDIEPLAYHYRSRDDLISLRYLSYETDGLQRRYLHPDDERLAGQIEQALPGLPHDIVSMSADESKLLIKTGGELEAARYWLLDRRAGRLMPLGADQPELKGVHFAPRRRYWFTSRDGLKMAGHLHAPAGKAQPPTVVYVRPAFLERTAPVFDPMIQLLVNRGYAVLQIDQRGAFGYGEKFSAAGEEKIDTAMADDIADGVAHAAREGWIDPARVAIYGHENGGVLATYSVARNPGQYTAWINVNTPMQRKAFRPENLALDSTEFRGRRLSVGQENRLRAYAATLDPSTLVLEIKLPSFHFYSSVNVVNLNGGKVRRLLEKSGAVHEFLTGLSSNAFGPYLPDVKRQIHEENIRLYTAMLEFLDRHLVAKPKQ